MDPLTIALALAGQFAPGIVKYFSGSDTAAAVAGQVVGIAQTVTGAATPEAARAVLQADPALALQFQTAVMANETELQRMNMADTQDARARDVALHKAGYTNHRADYMVAADAVGLVGCLVVLIFFRTSIPGEVVGLLSTIASIFGLCLRDAHQFEFGSSRGSREKDAMLGKKS